MAQRCHATCLLLLVINQRRNDDVSLEINERYRGSFDRREASKFSCADSEGIQAGREQGTAACTLRTSQGNDCEADATVTAMTGCECYRCVTERDERIGDWPISMVRMVLCSTCGCKRCPHATDHRFSCTASNEPGQAGSRYLGKGMHASLGAEGQEGST